MKASPSSASEEDEAENEDEDIIFDYCDFFSVLMYYGHMSKNEIMTHSRAFLHGIYRMYVKRACENLGVSSDRKENDDIDDTESQINQYSLSANDYPTSFSRLSPKKNKLVTVDNDPNKTREFLASFGGPAELFKDVQIATDT